ncbi:hypothetical protein NLG97_g5372 [Lecanicillium saksenae]|uniref:Uncharacterized protein n=1 Tax=Lecanicillium saksenae TaxID=468837 RepID=A0ACC1QUI8_9HYPO|nr:hypothetical protein NLG97_g5372 [Lecanicillium saksenae]
MRNRATRKYAAQLLRPKVHFHDFVNLRGCYDEFGGSPRNSTFALAVSVCLNDYCNNPFPQIGGCGKWAEPTEITFTISEMPYFLFHYLYFNNTAVCDHVRADTNSDMAGPGVFSSYLIQLYLSLFLCSLLQLSSAIARPSERLRRMASLLKQKAPAVLKHLSPFYHRHYAVLKHTLVEFHDAQCFLMFASQIATIYSLNNPELSQSYTLRSALQNIMVSCLISTIGILPVVLSMWTLYIEDECSAWIIFLSISTVCISEAALYKIKGISPMNHMSTIEYNRWPDSCGGSPPPSIYCGLAESDSEVLAWSKSYFEALNPVCLVTFLATIFLWIRRRFLKSKYAKNVAPFSIGKLVTILLTRIPAKLQPTAGGFVVALRATPAPVALLVVLLNVQFFHRSTSLVDWGNWSFGQAIAITIWLPVVSKYLYWLCFGTESYSKARIPSPYKIVKSAENDSVAIAVQAVGPRALDP